jgi:hypothetical protein
VKDNRRWDGKMILLCTLSHFFSAVLLSSIITQLASASLLELLPRVVVVQITTTATATVQLALMTSVPDIASYTDTNNLQADILNSTNLYRYEHNATALVWNTSLASYAQSWASRCKWKHSGGPYGENIASGYPDVTGAVDGWGNERAKYNFQQSTGFSKATGHFTQLVWKSTTSTGCAAVNCAGKGGMDGFFLVCEYYPPGNIVGEHNAFFAQNVQSQIHTSGPTAAGTAAATSTSANTTKQNGLGNEGTPGRAARGLWILATLFVALILADGII